VSKTDEAALDRRHAIDRRQRAGRSRVRAQRRDLCTNELLSAPQTPTMSWPWVRESSTLQISTPFPDSFSTQFPLSANWQSPSLALSWRLGGIAIVEADQGRRRRASRGVGARENRISEALSACREPVELSRILTERLHEVVETALHSAGHQFPARGVVLGSYMSHAVKSTGFSQEHSSTREDDPCR
jgi:hypothetical protein